MAREDQPGLLALERATGAAVTDALARRRGKDPAPLSHRRLGNRVDEIVAVEARLCRDLVTRGLAERA